VQTSAKLVPRIGIQYRNITNMTTKITSSRQSISFRFNEDLLNHLRAAAIRENRSLNNYVENILMDIVYKSSLGTTQGNTGNIDNLVASFKKVEIQKTIRQNKTPAITDKNTINL
jgi:hypothetical protein